MTRKAGRGMTRRRDNYLGQIDDLGERGALAALRDLHTALLILTRYVSSCGLRDATVDIGRNRDGSVERMTVGQLLRIASDAYGQSIEDVVFVYRQLRQNAEAADALAATGVDFEQDWAPVDDALRATLDRKPIARRGLVNAAKREVAALAAEESQR